MSAAPTPQPDQDFQYIKLPDGSYGKFRSDVDDATIKAQISKDFPDAYKDAPKAPAKPSLWQRANTPLVGEGEDERKAREFSTGLPTEFDIKHPIIGGIAKGVAGAGADIIGTARSFTSPASLAMLGLGPLGKVPGAIGKAAKAIQLGGSAVYGGEGAINAGKGILDVTKNGVTPENSQAVLQGASGVAGAGAGALHAGAGASPEIASGINNRLIGTSKAGYARGRDPGLAVAQEGIVANSKPALRRAIGDRISDLQSEKQASMAASPQTGDVSQSILKPVNDARAEAVRTGDKGMVLKLNDLEDRLTGIFKAGADSQPIKTGTRNLSSMKAVDIDNLKKDVGKVTDWKSHGIEYRDQLNAIKNQIYSNIDAVNDKIVPGYEDINRKQSNLIGAKKDLANKIVGDRKRSAFGMSDFLSLGSGMGAAGIFGHSIPSQIGLSLGGLALKKALTSPAIQTRVARGLATPSAINLGPGILATAPVGKPIGKTRKEDDDEGDK